MSTTIESVLQENRVFNPSPEFVAQANVSGMEAYKALCAAAEADYEGYWGKLARENVVWKQPFTTVLDESNAPFYKWFPRRQAECLLQLSRQERRSRPGRQGRHHLRSRQGRSHQGHLQGTAVQSRQDSPMR
jgi:hypothetical protein